ncbi:MAG: histidine phosphatase family protein [Chloroflexi bacterium]|nr:histidine phosphatase family protein [Chloroflexota bacterium]
MEEQPLELLLVRHGESYHNRDGTGGLDSDLTELGVEQARRLAPWLAADFKFAAIYSSPLVRARLTAEIAAAELSLPIQFKDDLREVDFEIGPMMAHSTDPISAFLRVPRAIETMPASYIEFEARVRSAFCDIIAANERGTLLVFTHGGVISTFLRTVFGAHQVSVHADNGSAMLLRWGNGRWYLVYSNRVPPILP